MRAAPAAGGCSAGRCPARGRAGGHGVTARSQHDPEPGDPGHLAEGRGWQRPTHQPGPRPLAGRVLDFCVADGQPKPEFTVRDKSPDG